VWAVSSYPYRRLRMGGVIACCTEDGFCSPGHESAPSVPDEPNDGAETDRDGGVLPVLISRGCGSHASGRLLHDVGTAAPEDDTPGWNTRASPATAVANGKGDPIPPFGYALLAGPDWTTAPNGAAEGTDGGIADLGSGDSAEAAARARDPGAVEKSDRSPDRRTRTSVGYVGGGAAVVLWARKGFLEPPPKPLPVAKGLFSSVTPGSRAGTGGVGVDTTILPLAPDVGTEWG